MQTEPGEYVAHIQARNVISMYIKLLKFWGDTGVSILYTVNIDTHRYHRPSYFAGDRHIFLKASRQSTNFENYTFFK